MDSATRQLGVSEMGTEIRIAFSPRITCMVSETVPCVQIPTLPPGPSLSCVVSGDLLLTRTNSRIYHVFRTSLNARVVS